MGEKERKTSRVSTRSCRTFIPTKRLDAVLLVYVTNLLAHEREAAETGVEAPAFDWQLLQEAGVADYLPDWRKIAEAAHLADAQPVRSA